MLRYHCNENHPGCLSNAIKSFSTGKRYIKLFSCLPNFLQSGVSIKMKERYSGILMHISSLPSQFGIGDLGPEAYQFVDLLAKNKQRFWQILPLNPTAQQHGNSPYHSFATFAGNPLFISPELLYQDGLLKKEEIINYSLPPKKDIDFNQVYSIKNKLLDKTYQRFARLVSYQRDYQEFCQQNLFWLEDYALFQCLKSYFQGKPWNQWPSEIKNRHQGTIQKLKKELTLKMEREKILQFLFFNQWNRLKNYCRKKKIKIIGDMPIYVTYNSMDVWCHPQLFKLDQNKEQIYKAGVPPDYFSKTGQLWGNPVYQWEEHHKEKYAWWTQRIKKNLQMVDLLRIDHFRGLIAYWEVPFKEKTAIPGHWVTVPTEDFLAHVINQFPTVPFIAEDLGDITEDVKAIIKKWHFPGMRVLTFAFGNDFPHSIHLPHHYEPIDVVYTGTHDNNTIQGWQSEELKQKHKKNIVRYLGKKINPEEIHWDFIRMVQASVAFLAIIPVQDVLGLGKEARMNNPANPQNNWQWRMTPQQRLKLEQDEMPKLKELSDIYDRKSE